MTKPFQGLGAVLPRLDPDRINWARAAVQRLMASGFDAAITPARGDDKALWYRGDRLAFAPLAPAPLDGAPADELIAVLSANEALLAVIERALGVAAEFATYAPLGEDVPVITLRRDGAVQARIAVFTRLEPLPSPPPPVLVRLACVGVRLSLADAERLEGGDMLVLTPGPWPLAEEAESALTAPGLPPLGFDPVTGKVAAILSPFSAASQGAPFAMPTSETPAGLTVPVVVHLSDIAITQADLARLSETGTFDLGAVSDGLTATLLVGGRRIGQGDIVRLGDRFAVLLDHVEAEATPGMEADENAPAPAAGEAA
jgi:flagellar motor switch/type III secretory pathway protein FliN